MHYQPPERRAIVLLSGGVDSATTLAMAKRQGFAITALSIDYGQRHRIELAAANAIAETMECRRHVVVPIDLRQIGGSALTDSIEVPKDQYRPDDKEIPVTYVPARNTIFLSIALGLAEVEGARDIFIGANALDYSGYPDCRPAFIETFETLANVATKAGVKGDAIRIQAPLLNMTKAEIIRLGSELGVDFAMTTSCYDPDKDGLSCGHCDSCAIRRIGFATAGIADPTRYAAELTVIKK
jgi:7-cyano-7-deazaguanine synthase